MSEEEKAVFAFFQLGERLPDYAGWINAMPHYLEATQDAQKQILSEEETRLKWGFGTYNHQQDFLKIKTAVELQVREKESQTYLHFRFPGSADVEYPYFPYRYKNAGIALVIENLGDFASIALDEKQLAKILPHFAGKTTINAAMKIRVRPLSADITAPLEMDGAYFWIMSGDIAYTDFKIGDEKLYSYTAPWYLSEAEIELFELLE